MSKTLIRWSLILVVLVATFFSWGVIDNSIAIALTEAEVFPKLEPVPVFVILDQQGNPLVANGDNTDEISIAGAFISPTDAKQFVNRLQTENSKLAEQVKVAPASLAAVYQQNKSYREQNLFFNFIPNEETLAYAKNLLPEKIRPGFQGVPLFVARDINSQQYLTISSDSEQITPFFFDNTQLGEMVSKYQESNPGEDTSVDIEVAPLENLIQALETESNEMLKSISLIPSTESQQFMQNLLQQQRNN